MNVSMNIPSVKWGVPTEHRYQWNLHNYYCTIMNTFIHCELTLFAYCITNNKLTSHSWTDRMEKIQGRYGKCENIRSVPVLIKWCRYGCALV